jgi:hypothetical protein
VHAFCVGLASTCLHWGSEFVWTARAASTRHLRSGALAQTEQPENTLMTRAGARASCAPRASTRRLWELLQTPPACRAPRTVIPQQAVPILQSVCATQDTRTPTAGRATPVPWVPTSLERDQRVSCARQENMLIFLLLCRVSRVLHTLNQRRAAATSRSVCAMLATWVVMREVASTVSQASMEATMARALSVTQASTLLRERQSAPSALRARGPLGGGVHAMIPRLPANLAPSVRLIHLCVHFVKLESLECTLRRASVFANIARLENIKTRRGK